jgi:peptidoglycan/xylan/chitin deacetylase (PgdA/CDA1 family)
LATDSLHLNLRRGALLAIAALLALAAAAAARADATVSACGGPGLRLPAHLPDRTLAVPILMYHRVNVVTASTPAASRPLTVNPADFARQMTWLARHGYRTVTQRELYEALMCGRRLGPKPIMITFDDGYRDTFFKASPVIARLGMHATAYVVTGRISGPDPSFLTWPLLHALERRGIEIASHTMFHRDLRTLSDRDLLEDLMTSRRTLERELGHPVPWLAYPFGAYDGRVERMARRAGYLLATTTRPGVLQFARQPLALHRLRVLDTTGVRGLAAMLEA